MASQLSKLTVEELFTRKITASVERELFSKADFSKGCAEWCDKACNLKHKNPPSITELIPSRSVDVLVIQDYRAFDDIKFKKRGKDIELKLTSIVTTLLKQSLGPNLSFALTTLLKCNIEDTDLRKGAAPSSTTLIKCRPFLWEEIKARKPKVIISLSTPVTKVLTSKLTNYGNRGQIAKVTQGPEEIHGIPLVITLHHRILTMLRQNSSGKFWGPDFLSVIQRDFIKARRLAEGVLQVPNLDIAIDNAKKRITIARSIEDVERLTADLIRRGQGGAVLSYDTETTSLDPYLPTAKLITAQFGFRNEKGITEAYVFPLWHRENKWYDAEEAWEFIKPILIDDEIKKIGHNIKFDILYTFTTTGTRLRGVFLDTMLLLHAINSGIQGCYGLKLAVWDWLPDTELGGYEDKLPALTKVTEVKEDEDEEERGDI